MNATCLNAEISQLIMDLLPTGCPSIVIVSRHCGIPVRTLQRKLRNDGITYRELVDEVRFDAACRLLRQPQNNVKEVARAIGYQDPSNFTRAFQRWAGVSPSEYQRQQAKSSKKLRKRLGVLPIGAK
jgi:AraC-like DNA-binding protein